ncbi:MAG: caspase family protein [Planctomycetes bacterium]|nr:caspase family protein [Planctomycetota bacterium]
MTCAADIPGRTRRRAAGAVPLAALAVLAAVLALALAPAAAAAPAPEAAPQGTCRALLVGAMPGGPDFARRYRDWLLRFRAYLVEKAGVPAANVAILSGDKDFKDAAVAGVATAESVRKALADLAARSKPEDQVIVLLVGHGVVSDRIPTLVLPGPDLDAEQLAAALAAVPAKNQVVLNLSSASGAAVKALAAKGRVVVAATSPIEGNEPVFPEFFLRGLESGRADGEGAPAAGAKDGCITVLEAYNWATHQAALWVSRLRQLEGGQWRLDGKESVEIFEKLYTGGPFRLDSASDRGKPDEAVAIVPENGKISEAWLARRVLSEHATLEDSGEEIGAAAVRDEGYEPLAGAKPGEPGCLARRTVLGRAALLPAPADGSGAP